MSDSLKDEFQIRNFGLNYPDVGVFVQSQWSLAKWFYPAWRAFWLVWHLVWIVVSGVRTRNTAPDDDDGHNWFILLSNVTFLVTTVTCLVDFTLVILSTCSGNKTSATPQENDPSSEVSSSTKEKDEVLFHGEFTLIDGMKIPSTPLYFQFVWMLYEAMNCANLLSTIMFWAVEYDGEVIHADVIVFNVINIVFVITNLMVAAYPVRLLHFIFPGIYVALYFLFNLIYYLCDGTNFDGSDVTFEALDWGDSIPTAVTIPVGLLVAVPLGHLAFFTLYTLRVYLANRQAEDDNGQNNYTSTGHYRKRGSNSNIEAADTSHSNQGFEMDMGSSSIASY